MKLLIILLSGTLSLSAFAQWRLPSFGNDSTGGLRAVWSCPTQNRGEMPAEKEVEIYYDEFGTMKFRPDIFRMRFNPIRELGKLFGRSRSANDVDDCLRSFLRAVPRTIRSYQASQCQGLTELACSRNPDLIMSDLQSSVRTSAFYNRYNSQLANVTELTSRPRQDPVTVVESNPDTVVVETGPLDPSEVPVTPEEVTRTPEVVSPVVENSREPERREVVSVPTREEVPRPTADVDRARTRLLDYMTENSSRIERLKDFANFCPDLGDTTGPNASYCRQTMNLNSDFLNRVSQMFTAVRGAPVSVSRVVQSLECVPPTVNEFSDIEGILRRLDSKEECAPLPNVGDFKLFRKKQSPPSWYTTGNYLLKKTGDNEYEATLALDFRNQGGSATPDQMMASVRSCLGTANPYLRGPSGEKIAIRALTPQEAETQLSPGERPGVGVINIQPDGIAIDAANFSGNADCPTITHELLHHLGLCDEYKETRTNILPMMTRSRAEEWSCRNVPERTSIMKNHVEAFNTTVAQQFTCECVSPVCSRTLNSANPQDEAHRKLLMTANAGYILRNNSGFCRYTVLPTTTVVPEADKGYVDVEVSGGTLSFQQRSLFASGNQFLISRANVTCTCPEGNAECPGELSQAAELLRQNPQTESCPLFTRPVGQKSAAPEGAASSVNGSAFTVVTIPRNPSLLTPSHFDKILTGSCMTSPSSLYKQCSQYAYVAQDDAACASKPAACSDDNQVFGVTQQ